MGRPKKNAENPQESNTVADISPESKPTYDVGPGPEPEPATAKQVKERISIALTSSGAIDFESMRPATKEKLMGALSKVTPGAVSVESQPTLDPENFGEIWKQVTPIEQFIAVKLMKIPPHIAVQAFVFTDEMCEKLSKPTAIVLDKYAGDKIAQWVPEISLGMILMGCVRAQFDAAKKLVLLEAQKQPKVVAEMPRTDPVPPASDTTIQ